MKTIIVCFKITYDYDEMSVNDWSRCDDLGRPNADFVRRILGCFDEAALENGLLLKSLLQSSGEDVSLIALTVNPGYSEHIIKRIAAVGYDRIVTVQTEEELDFCPEGTAQILADVIKEISDTAIVLTGAQCAPGNTGLVPYLLAENLNAGAFRNVTRFFEYSESVWSEGEVDGGFVSESVKPGTVYVLNNTEKSYLRIPTLKEKMKFKSFEPEQTEKKTVIANPGMTFQTAVTERQCEFPDAEGIDFLLRELKEEV